MTDFKKGYEAGFWNGILIFAIAIAIILIIVWLAT